MGLYGARRRGDGSPEYWHCGRKKRFVRRRDAERVVEGVDESGLNVYRCEYCSRFHIGHRAKWNLGHMSKHHKEEMTRGQPRCTSSQ